MLGFLAGNDKNSFLIGSNIRKTGLNVNPKNGHKIWWKVLGQYPR
jgi:hypothetical protein